MSLRKYFKPHPGNDTLESLSLKELEALANQWSYELKGEPLKILDEEVRRIAATLGESTRSYNRACVYRFRENGQEVVFGADREGTWVIVDGHDVFTSVEDPSIVPGEWLDLMDEIHDHAMQVLARQQAEKREERRQGMIESMKLPEPAQTELPF